MARRRKVDPWIAAREGRDTSPLFPSAADNKFLSYITKTMARLEAQEKKGLSGVVYMPASYIKRLEGYAGRNATVMADWDKLGKEVLPFPSTHLRSELRFVKARINAGKREQRAEEMAYRQFDRSAITLTKGDAEFLNKVLRLNKQAKKWGSKVVRMPIKECRRLDLLSGGCGKGWDKIRKELWNSYPMEIHNVDEALARVRERVALGKKDKNDDTTGA